MEYFPLASGVGDEPAIALFPARTSRFLYNPPQRNHNTLNEQSSRKLEQDKNFIGISLHRSTNNQLIVYNLAFYETL